MNVNYLITLDTGEKVEVSSDQRDLFALRRRGFRDLGYSSGDEAMRVVTEAQEQPFVAMECVAWLVWNAGKRDAKWDDDFDTFVETRLVGLDTQEVGVALPTLPAPVAS